ncbi:hypothetical protein [Gloeothece verrucosa]|uniref:Uncharacterized protein n=1 Tax=Gloeothece verrucosa (strain PCC 7822) TaxID=497965 RepID=E0U781_GLOV7|nr:hypothetical protein [Gloeothece verrucosa]ADN12468.1 hypothetical protein Cyan7822_0423 [Gloeothece verrucosa PCC 7822]
MTTIFLKNSLVGELKNSPSISHENLKQIEVIVDDIYHLIDLEQEKKQQNMQQEFQERNSQLETMADLINDLSNELETKLFEFKKLADNLHKIEQELKKIFAFNYSCKQASHHFYHPSINPCILIDTQMPFLVKQENKFILETKKIELLKAHK